MIYTTDKMIDVNSANAAANVQNQYDCLIGDVDVNHQIVKTDESDYMDRYLSQPARPNHFASLNSFQKHKANCNVKLSPDYMLNMNKFQFVLMAPTSPAVKVNEDTLTYLNQGQNYELKLSNNEAPQMNQSSQMEQNFAYQNEDIKPFINLDTKSIESGYLLSSQSNGTTLNQIVRDTNEHELNDKLPRQENCGNNQNLHLDLNAHNSLVYLSVVRVCFWDRKLQEMEQDEIKEKWEKEYPNMRMLEIDSNSSYGIVEVRMSDAYTNAAEILWNGRTGANIFFRCNCTSTAFAPHKHGGEKGIHMRFQIDTYEIAVQNAKITYSNEILGFNSSHSSLGSSASNSIGSILSPPNSTSSPNSIKFIKDDLDSNRSMGTPTPTAAAGAATTATTATASTNCKQWLEFNEVKHLCGSYCRIQLFRLKGAQRKLKTDRSKIDRLNPPDLRKRYQPSNKITLLNNCSYDWLYSLLPFVKEPNQPTTEINAPHMDNNYQAHHSHYVPNADFSISSNAFSQSHATNNAPFAQNPAYPSMNLNGNIEFMNNMSQSQYASHYSSLDTSMSTTQNESNNALYLDNCYQHMNQASTGSTNSIQNHDYGYHRMKRTSSFNSPSNYQNFKPSKMQKTGLALSTVSSPQIFNTTFNNMSSLASSSSSASTSSCTSSPASPISPMISLHQQQSQLVSGHNLAQLDYTNTAQSCPLPYDCSNKYVQEWLIQNRFFNLLGVFSNYTSNDVLRLSKEDMITLCGGADGIRCYNMAHNIQIKPKLTIFVTFNDQSYFSAIFLTDSKSSFLLSKLLSVFATFVKNLKSIEEKNEKMAGSESGCESDEEKSLTNLKQSIRLHERILSGNFDYELFLKVKGALVKATDEVLNNFDDQSKFLIDFEILDQQTDLNKTSSLPSKLNSLASNLAKAKPSLVRVMLIPLD